MEGSEHVPQQVGTGLGEVFFEEAGRVDTGCDGHRRGSFVVVPFEMDLAVLSKDHAVTVASCSDTLTEIRCTTLKDATTRLLQLVAGQRPFRRPGRFVLGLLDVLAMR
jgi:hypothetical protein